MTTLRELRLHLYLSQDEVAKAVGVSVTTYSYWEAGKRKPTLKHLRKLAEALQVEPSEVDQVIIETGGKEAA